MTASSRRNRAVITFSRFFRSIILPLMKFAGRIAKHTETGVRDKEVSM
jgi:hypothetical protein